MVTVLHSVAPKVTYSTIYCSSGIYCNNDLTNGATNVYINLNNAKAAVALPHAVSMTGGTYRKENGYIIFPVIDAVSS